MVQIKNLEEVVKRLVENGDDFEDIVEYIMFLSPDYTYEDATNIIMKVEAKIDGLLYDDSMDGDHASALSSVGWGTDEDYGYSSDDY
jgi:hypothetical protein